MFEHIKNLYNLHYNKWQIKKWNVHCCTPAQEWVGKLHIVNYGRFQIGQHVLIRSAFESNVVGGYIKTSFWIDSGGELQIGEKVGISNSVFYCADSITIEDNVLIGAGCLITDSDSHSIDYYNRCIMPHDTNIKKAPIIINEGAFIGANSIILKGVTIGKHSVIGAGSVCTKSVPDFELWAGNPARFVKCLEK